MFRRCLAVAVFALVGLATLAPQSGLFGQENQDPKKSKFFNDTFRPTEDEISEKMLELCKVKKTDLIFDLGCGEGHMLILAAQKFGCKGIGLELNAERAEVARKKVKDAGLEKMIEIRTADALTVKDIDKANIVMLYMFPQFHTWMWKAYEDKFTPGTRVASHDYKSDEYGPKPDTSIEDFKTKDGRTARIYHWVVKDRKKAEKSDKKEDK